MKKVTTTNKKNHIKGTWKILNTIIRREQRHSAYPDKFKCNGENFIKKFIVNGFNDCFVHVGTNLANDIKPPGDKVNVLDYLKASKPKSMFLAGVDESEIVNVVRNCKNKKSTGYDNIIDMNTFKGILYHTVKPLTYTYVIVLLKMGYF